MKKIIAIILIAILTITTILCMAGCSEAERASYNISKEAGNIYDARLKK